MHERQGTLGYRMGKCSIDRRRVAVDPGDRRSPGAPSEASSSRRARAGRGHRHDADVIPTFAVLTAELTWLYRPWMFCPRP